MRISDWSSDVCSSDLTETFRTAINDAASLTQFLLESLIKQVNLGSLEGRARLIALARPHVDKLPAGALRTLLIDELGRRARLGDRKRVVLGKSVSVRVDRGGRRLIKKQKKPPNNTS